MTTTQLVDKYLQLYIVQKRYEKQLEQAKAKLLPRIGTQVERGGFVLSKRQRTVFSGVTLETARQFHATKTAIDTEKLQAAIMDGARVRGITHTEYLNVQSVVA